MKGTVVNHKLQSLYEESLEKTLRARSNLCYVFLKENGEQKKLFSNYFKQI